MTPKETHKWLLAQGYSFFPASKTTARLGAVYRSGANGTYRGWEGGRFIVESRPGAGPLIPKTYLARRAHSSHVYAGETGWFWESPAFDCPRTAHVFATVENWGLAHG